jgi:hypothetical protein
MQKVVKMMEKNQDLRIQLVLDLKKLFDMAFKMSKKSENCETWTLLCCNIADAINALMLNLWQEQIENAKVRLGRV